MIIIWYPTSHCVEETRFWGFGNSILFLRSILYQSDKVHSLRQISGLQQNYAKAVENGQVEWEQGGLFLYPPYVIIVC